MNNLIMPLHLRTAVDVCICQLGNWILFFTSALQNAGSAGRGEEVPTSVCSHMGRCRVTRAVAAAEPRFIFVFAAGVVLGDARVRDIVIVFLSCQWILRH